MTRVLRQKLPDALGEGDGIARSIVEFESKFPHDPPDQIRVLQLVNLLQAANILAPGDYIELGVHVGLTLKIIHWFMDPKRSLYALDTFTGFDVRDIKEEDKVNGRGWTVGGFTATSAEEVGRYLGNPGNLHIVPGWFPGTWQYVDERLRWRFAHVDMDLYQPTAAALRLLWPRMVPGGVIAVHDYGCSSFLVRRAVDEFCGEIGLPPVEMPDRWGTAVLRKPLR
jgi:O-methyltransferase